MLESDNTVLVIIDVQERMMAAIDRSAEVTDRIRRLVLGCHELGIPMLVTEQYSKGLGATVAPIREALGDAYSPIEKITFSAAEEYEFMQHFESTGRQQVLICGVETHVCVYQSAADLRELGWEVEVVADAVGSRTQQNRLIALGKLPRLGVELSTVEMALFELMVRADVPPFKAVSSIVK